MFKPSGQWLRSWWVAAALACAIAAGSAWFVFFQDYPADRDAKMYLRNADAFLTFEKGALRDFHYRYIAYSALIGTGQHALGLERKGVKFLNLLMHVGAGLLIFGLARRQTRLAILPPFAMAMAGLYPLSLYMTGMILTETLFSLLLVALAFLSVSLMERDRVSLWASLGAVGFFLSTTRPTGHLVMAFLSVLLVVHFLLARRSWRRAAVVLVWLPMFWLGGHAYRGVFVEKNAPSKPVVKEDAAQVERTGAYPAWLVLTTYVTDDGDHYDALRARQAQYARENSAISDISRYMHEQEDALEAQVLKEAAARYDTIPGADELRDLAPIVNRSLFLHNLRRHPVHVGLHFVRNAFWNMWFTRDSMKDAAFLVALNLPYVLMGLVAVVGLVWGRRWRLLLVFAGIILPI
ncbi:hypothetical protein HQ520_02430 [bacterium]|nr:hypothetical protein [bacterium]